METRKKPPLELLGQKLHIEVDRPIGYRHGQLVYPVNYGYVPGMAAGDGEDQDAYILGISEPLRTFDGQVIGIVRRKNDCEDKLVVAPEGTVFHQAQIAEAVRFQEQHFDTFIESAFRKSCGVIPFRQVDGKREFLILLQTSHSWSFPKGHMEAGETEKQTALRELHEETGLTATLIPDAVAVTQYAISPLVHKQVVLFLGQVHGDVSLQETEISGSRWVTADELSHYLHPNTYEACAHLVKDPSGNF